ncbi:glycerophosphodiester phosphodiesterase [Flavobacterium alvei]|uniref:Glycerophosphodiester phosphodiesterase n=1 Tax=Flavobacterium alvei TaxID=2080416 RepID=A0A2S5ADI5_9FLAO|nr:glycerophosphodiester phosphodiesterase family protein [Flavobacterium alvei]POY40359.1 glycerophosphodiester phosphodiesterase [Flavobacterium alvei]HQF47278.1 glycerophosphodiester phosphodiesterase family protein [Flavobacterium alvei]
MNQLLKIGHRGVKGYEPENTLISFQKAIDLKVDGIELDVHLSSDGEIIVIHDETIDRTTNGKGLVKNFSSLQLKQFGIPTLSEVLELINKQCFVNIELKGIGTSKPVAEFIALFISQKNWNHTDFLVSSFDWKMLEEVQLLNPKIRIGVLTEESVDLALAFAKKIKAYSIHPDYRLLTKENVALMQENEFEVYPWTVNSKEDIQKIKSFNVNGIISDFPDKI